MSYMSRRLTAHCSAPCVVFVFVFCFNGFSSTVLIQAVGGWFKNDSAVLVIEGYFEKEGARCVGVQQESLRKRGWAIRYSMNSTAPLVRHE